MRGGTKPGSWRTGGATIASSEAPKSVLLCDSKPRTWGHARYLSSGLELKQIPSPLPRPGQPTPTQQRLHRVLVHDLSLGTLRQRRLKHGVTTSAACHLSGIQSTGLPSLPSPQYTRLRHNSGQAGGGASPRLPRCHVLCFFPNPAKPEPKSIWCKLYARPQDVVPE